VPSASGYITFDGDGFFPVVVQVVTKDYGKPIEGAVVTLENVGKYEGRELDPKRKRTVLPAHLGKSVATAPTGLAVVYYYGRWSSSGSGKASTYSRSLKGTIVVKIDGKEVFRKDLLEWSKEKNFTPQGHDAPWIVVEVPRIKNQPAQQVEAPDAE